MRAAPAAANGGAHRRRKDSVTGKRLIRRLALVLGPRRVASILAAMGMAAVAFTLAAGGDGPNTAFTVAFLVAAPATAAAVPLRRVDPLARIVIALAAAVVVNALVAETMLATDTWSVQGGVAAVGVISVLTWLATSASWASSVASAGRPRKATDPEIQHGDGMP